jgi:hypothetical protein
VAAGTAAEWSAIIHASAAAAIQLSGAAAGISAAAGSGSYVDAEEYKPTQAMVGQQY